MQSTGGGFFVSIKNVWFINGIVSASFLTSEKHCDVSKYALYTKLSDFKDWITEKVESVVISGPTCNESRIHRKTCSSIDNLYDNAGTRRYLKSLCTISGRVTFDEARQKCNSAGMQLFTIGNSAEQSAFLDAITAQFANYNSSVGWVNGKLKPNGQWVSLDPEAPLFKGLNWSEGPNNSGKCLKVHKNTMNEQQHFSSRYCSKTHWALCEFKDDDL